MFGGRTIISLCLLLIVDLLEKIQIKGMDSHWPLAGHIHRKTSDLTYLLWAQVNSIIVHWAAAYSGLVTMITMRTDDHDEDWWSWRGLMIMTRTEDHDKDWWSWRGPMIMTRTWSSPDHNEGSPTLSNARRDLERDELANLPVSLVDAAPEKNKNGSIKTLSGVILRKNYYL